MGHFEGQTGRNGFLLDTLYINLGDDPVTRPLTHGTLVADGDLRALIHEVAGIYNPRGDGTGFAFIYGTRLFDVRDDMRSRITDKSVAKLGSVSLLGESAVDITPALAGTPIPEYGYVPTGKPVQSFGDVRG